MKSRVKPKLQLIISILLFIHHSIPFINCPTEPCDLLSNTLNILLPSIPYSLAWPIAIFSLWTAIGYSALTYM